MMLGIGWAGSALAAIPDDHTSACVVSVLTSTPNIQGASAVPDPKIYDFSGNLKAKSSSKTISILYFVKDGDAFLAYGNSGKHINMIYLSLSDGDANRYRARLSFPRSYRKGQTMGMLEKESPDNPLRDAINPLSQKCNVDLVFDGTFGEQ